MDVLDSIRVEASDVVAEVSQRGDAAVLHLSTPGRPGRWAVVSTPGDRWFSLEVDGGYSLDHFEEETSDDDARRLLRLYTSIGLDYLRQAPTPARTSPLSTPTVVVTTGTGDVVLRRSLSKSLQSLLRLGRRSNQ
jgi:hypothetical protein